MAAEGTTLNTHINTHNSAEAPEDILVGSGQVHQPAAATLDRGVLVTPGAPQARTLTSQEAAGNPQRDVVSGPQSGLSGATGQRLGLERSAQYDSRLTSTARNAQELDEGPAHDQSKLSSYWKLEELVTDKQATARNDVSQTLGASAVPSQEN